MLQAVYEADVSRFSRSADVVDARLRQNAREADKATREIEQAYSRAGGAIQNIFGRLPGGSRLSALSSLKTDLDDLRLASQTAGGGLAGLSAGLGSIGGPAVLATAGVGALTAALTAVAGAVFSAAKNFSDSGSAIFDMSRNVGFSAEVLSGFKVSADEAGSSLEQVGAGLNRFNKLIGDAATGGKEATETLKRFGLEPQEALRDSEAALQKVLDRIRDLPEGTARATAAQMAFGRGGAELVSTLETMGFSLDQAKQKAADLGVLFDTTSSQQADSFGDALTQLQNVATGLANSFGREVAPEITDAMQDITREINNNRDAATEWGNSTANVIRGVREVADSELGALVARLAQTAWQISNIGAAAAGLNLIGASSRAGGGPVGDPGVFGSNRFIGGNIVGMQGLGSAAQERIWQTIPDPGSNFFRSMGGGGGGRRRGGGGGGGRSRTRDTSRLSDDLWEGFEDSNKELEKTLATIAQLDREFETFGDTTRRTALETRILAGEFHNLTETEMSAMLEKAGRMDAAEGWEKFTEHFDDLTVSLAELKGEARDLTAFEEFQKQYDALMHSIVGTKNFIDPAKEAIIELAKQAAHAATLLQLDKIALAVPLSTEGADRDLRQERQAPKVTVDRWKEYINELKEEFKTLGSEIESELGGAIERVLVGDWRGAMQGMVAMFSDALARMAADLIRSEVSGFLTGLIKTGIGAIAGGLLGGVNTNWGGPSGGTTPASILFGGSRDVGGPMDAGKLYKVHADEWIVPLRDAHVFNKDQVSQMAGRGGPTVVNNNTIVLPRLPATNHIQRQSRQQLAESLLSALGR